MFKRSITKRSILAFYWGISINIIWHELVSKQMLKLYEVMSYCLAPWLGLGIVMIHTLVKITLVMLNMCTYCKLLLCVPFYMWCYIIWTRCFTWTHPSRTSTESGLVTYIRVFTIMYTAVDAYAYGCLAYALHPPSSNKIKNWYWVKQIHMYLLSLWVL